MTLEHLLVLYNSHQINGLSFIGYFVSLVTKDNVNSLMLRCPQDLLETLEDHVRGYDPKQMILIGGAKLARQEAIDALRGWFKSKEAGI